MRYKLLFLPILIIVAFTNAKAQEEINIYVGYNHSTVTFTNLSESGWNFKPGYFIGIENLKSLRPKLDLTTNLQFSGKGWIQGKTKQSSNYIDLINTISYRPIDQISMFGGINTGYLINNNDIIDNKFDLGLVIGGGFHFKNWNLKLHYNYGLLSIDDDLSTLLPDNINVLNTNFQIGLGYNLHRGGKSLLKTKNPYNEHNIGIRIFGLNSSFSFLYKKKIAPNKYFRVNSGIILAEFLLNDNRKNSARLGFQLTAGIERVVPFNEKLNFIHGLLPSIFLDKNNDNVNISGRLGYLLGLSYDYTESLKFGIEVTPGISTSFEYRTSIVNRDVPISLSLNASSISIFGLYRFEYLGPMKSEI